jgi:hypothetical protein
MFSITNVLLYFRSVICVYAAAPNRYAHFLWKYIDICSAASTFFLRLLSVHARIWSYDWWTRGWHFIVVFEIVFLKKVFLTSYVCLRFLSVDFPQRGGMLWFELQQVNGRVVVQVLRWIAPKLELFKFCCVDINSEPLSELLSLKPQVSCTPRSLL